MQESSEFDKKLFFEFLIIRGLRRIGREHDERYISRAKHEFDRMVEKNYINYFLCAWDFTNWAKNNGIGVGPGRGSAGASLISYCLNITEVDPIEHDLLFSRFLSPARRDAPDIDTDFDDIRRQEVFDYLKNKWGEKSCAKIITYARFHPKGILKDVGRIFSIPTNETNKVSSLVLERSGGDARASFALTDTFSEFNEAKEFLLRYPDACDVAMKLEGHIRHKGVHAAAMVAANFDIGYYVPITKVGGEIVTEWEKQTCEDMNLVKFDILGLKTLSILSDCIKSSGVAPPREFNDINVYRNVFQSGRTLGIFQFNGVGITKFIMQFKIETFEQLYDSCTLFRPGALHSGQAQIYVNRMQGKEPAIPFHPLLEDITKKTMGIILYQEQIQKIMINVGCMSVATAEFARKVITKSKGKEAFNKLRDEFVRNANRVHGMEKEDAQKLYDVVSTFGSYSFNQTHALCYSIIGYWCAWYKTYHPLAFFKAIMKYEDDTAVIQDAMRDAQALGIKIEYPDINKSTMSYEIFDGAIYAGLNAIVGVGDTTAKKIIKNRPYTSIEDFKKRAKVSEKIFKGLIVANAFREFKPNKQAWYLGRPELDDDFTDIEWSQLIYQLTTLKPQIDMSAAYDFGKYPFIDIAKLDESHGGTMQFVRGIVTAIINKDKLLRPELNDHIHKFQRHMYYVNVNDGTGNLAIQLGPATYEKYAEMMECIEKQPIVAWGTLSKDGKKMYGDVLQIVSKEHRTYDIDNIMSAKQDLRRGEAIIVSAQPAVSKNKKSYYRVTLHNGVNGMCFRFSQKLQPGLKVAYGVSKPPFIDLRIINEVPK